MNRRNFLRTGGALSIPALLQGGIAASPLELFTQFLDPNSDRVLVLIRLSGGNDGLNTLIGIDQLANLRSVRPNVALPDNGYINLNARVGLHKNMTGMRDLFDAGKLTAIQAVGYPNQNRSHFRSTDIWTSASAADEVLSTGWFGRYLEQDHPDFPIGYPNPEFDYPLAMTMGNVVSETCQGTSSNFSVAVNNPFNFLYIAPGGDTALPGNYYGDEVSFVRNLIGQSNQYGDVVQGAANAGNSLATNYTTGTLSNQLRNIAYLLSGGIKTRIFIATLGGFDTHSAQVIDDNSVGTHANLMTELSSSIKAFMDDLQLLGLSKRVLGLTFSEFGRRIRSNQSNGTDHGDAGPLFLFGDCVQGGVLGNNPEIDPAVEQNVGVPYQYDFRDVYGSVLVDWFNVPQPTVQNLISGGFVYLPLANACNTLLDANPLTFDLTAEGYNDDVLVSWADREHLRSGGFTVQRSEDGRNFRDIRRVAADNRETTTAEYQIRDNNVVRNRIYYYRIRKDGGGDAALSPIVTAQLRGSAKGEWSVGLPRPNPVREDSYIKVYAPVDATATFELIDARGSRLRTGTVTLLGGADNRIPLRAGDLPAGSYVWRLRTPAGQEFARKLVR
ncbi:DUF1501 domain-containing protein [Neolewinella lacunae]|uniref:DUF1501 domain-containing protein n=1 Tax=Neolewinella lacunae TaxID=1517758 RepID=A0A923PIB3_9BACT|nr:DUF1501 domain-containing protein [Neolewinella lacunae]MBC6994673.1 DUF1501 domain-containing protein [Neolewinella lacunae]MDN3634545.1 DUF1501 domain-containing protein [Neolewinella lacunae]